MLRSTQSQTNDGGRSPAACIIRKQNQQIEQLQSKAIGWIEYYKIATYWNLAY